MKKIEVYQELAKIAQDRIDRLDRLRDQLQVIRGHITEIEARKSEVSMREINGLSDQVEQVEEEFTDAIGTGASDQETGPGGSA